MFNLSPNTKLGYYRLGDKVIYGKVEALIEATKLNQFPEWNFNRDIFDKITVTLQNK